MGHSQDSGGQKQVAQKGWARARLHSDAHHGPPSTYRLRQCPPAPPSRTSARYFCVATLLRRASSRSCLSPESLRHLALRTSNQSWPRPIFALNVYTHTSSPIGAHFTRPLPAPSTARSGLAPSPRMTERRFNAFQPFIPRKCMKVILCLPFADNVAGTFMPSTPYITLSRHLTASPFFPTPSELVTESANCLYLAVDEQAFVHGSKP